MPQVRTSINEAVQRVDRNLRFKWDPIAQRFVLVRYRNGAPVYDEILMIENADGTYREPDNRVLEYLAMTDLARFPGNTPEERMSRFLRWKNENNETVKARLRKAGLGDRYDRYRDWAHASKRMNGDPARTELFMLGDKERLDEMDITRAQRRRLERGHDPRDTE
ncbi:MAG: hypothetical protein MJA83_07605 [Gammaproteobacteria bacterium]|nr:hypothetical protein [Gammaproteobacteria bacterium]